MNWDSNWDEAQCLRMYIEKGFVAGLTAAKVAEKYPEFAKFTNKALTGGLKTLRDSVAKEMVAARAAGSNGAFTWAWIGLGFTSMTSLAHNCCCHCFFFFFQPSSRTPTFLLLALVRFPRTVRSGRRRRCSFRGDKPQAIAVNVNDISDAVSRLGFGDDSVFGDVTVGYKSAYQQAVEKGEKVAKTATYRGNTECGLPYIVDLWRDCNGRVRISIQLWCLSGDDFHTKLLARVSTSAKAFVISWPMNPNMERGDHAFHSFIMDQAELTKFQMDALMYIVKNHPKSIARIQSVSMVKQRQQTEEGARYHEQRIPLPRKVMHQLATEVDGDAFFHGLKFVKYEDGSVHMHAELLGEQKDCYTPEERKQAPVTKVAKSPPLPTNVPVPMETGSVAEIRGARVLDAGFEPDTDSPRRSSKRRSTGGETSSVVQNVHEPGAGPERPAAAGPPPSSPAAGCPASHPARGRPACRPASRRPASRPASRRPASRPAVPAPPAHVPG